MSLQGSAFLAMWNDIATEGEPEFNLWHTREHMPEWVAIPDFLVGRRYVDWSLDTYRHFTLYEGRTLGVFCSEPYLERLNAPTPWSTRVQPYFRKFLRSACQTVVITGRGFGGALLTARLDFTAGGRSTFAAQGAGDARRLGALDGVTGVHIGVTDPSVTSVKTAETELKKSAGETVFDGVVLVEGMRRCELQAVLPCVEELLIPDNGVARAENAVFELAYLLTTEGVA